MSVTADTILQQCQAYAGPKIDADRAAQLAVEINSLLVRATPLIERYRYLYADPFAFLSELETLAVAESGEGRHDGGE